jgi:hypothetical protein
MNPNPPGSLEDQIGELCSRIRLLEEALANRGIIVNQPAPWFPPIGAQASPVHQVPAVFR